ncbi:MAG: thiamine diphosphokinase [Bacteroidia bacterium]|nr:thiamine diphosphokinase [Bacteroidia bacterium]
MSKTALIIANGEQCSDNLLQKFIKNNCTIVVLDGAVEIAIKSGIKLDILLGDFDRINTYDIKPKLPENVKIVSTPNQNKTDLEKAIEYLIDKKYLHIDILWATGKRSDHTFNNIITIGKYYKKINCIIHDDYSSIYALPLNFEKKYNKGQVISLFPLGKVTGINTTGLVYEMKNQTLSLPAKTGTSNETIKNGIIKIEHKTGDLVLMECKD